MKQGPNQTRPKPAHLFLLSLACIVSLGACSAEIAKTVIDGFIDGTRIGLHEAIDAHFDEPSEEDEHSDFEDLF